MSAQAITLHLPLPLYGLLQQRAQKTRRSLEAEILEVVTSAVRPGDDLPPDLREALGFEQDESDMLLRAWSEQGPQGPIEEEEHETTEDPGLVLSDEEHRRLLQTWADQGPHGPLDL